MCKLKTILLRLPAPLIAGTLWFLSSQSTLPQPPGVLGWDKLQHLLAYGVLGLAIGLWISPGFWRSRSLLALLLTTLIGSAYGAIDEIHQYFVPGRHSNILDWVANTLGSFLGALAIMIVMKKSKPAETT
ncbi:MAG: VanZ family protein [Treponema sp.]|nr:VanZ family protein [Treponema sp.]